MKLGVARAMKLKAVMAMAAAALAMLTLGTREWIEILFKVDPDGGSGALEWLIVAALGIAACALGLWARADWKHLRPA